MNTQTDQVLGLLRRQGTAGVTPLLALNEIGCFRLAARIWDLRTGGYLIVNNPLRVGRKTVACYVLAASPTQLRIDGSEEVIAEILV
jgi:hypothetical protein